MIKQIWKYKLTSPIEMPLDAKILTIQMQGNEPHIWALVNPKNETETRKFVIIGTGHNFDDNTFKYVNTYQEGPFVWHVFEDVK